MSNHTPVLDYDPFHQVRRNGNRMMGKGRGVFGNVLFHVQQRSGLVHKLTCLSFLLWATIGLAIGETPGTYISNDEDRFQIEETQDYLGYENCRKCHQMQVEKLVTTNHFTSFETAHRSKAAKSFCQQLGIRSIKREQRCVRCHYTPESSSRGVRAQSGISCESCHGPAKKWIQGHNDYGGLTVSKAQETVAHKLSRITSSIEKGMRHPANLYLLAKSCYECHLVDDAELVNLTDHPAISENFDMVSWSQGSMRHNFLRTENKFNAESSAERLRVMFVVDLLAKLEATLQSLANSQADSEHFEVMQRQYILTAKKLFAVSGLVKNAQIEKAIAVLKQASPDAEQDTHRVAAKKISQLAFEFGKQEKVHLLDGIQSMLPSKTQYR